MELLNKVERTKKKKELLIDIQKVVSEPFTTRDSHSCSEHQCSAKNSPYKFRQPFSKGVISLGPTGNITTETKVNMPSLRKDSDHQKGVSNWVNESTNNLKTKSLWVQRFYRNSNRKPFLWNLNTGCEEGEGRHESLEGEIDTRVEDINCLNEWNSSDSEDTEENLSIPESDEGETDPPKTEDIL